MTSIIYIGMDVHTTNFTVCAYRIGSEAVFGETNFTATAENIVIYLETLRYNETKPEEVKFIYGYEAGCLGYSLYRELTAKGIECKILAPSTMATTPMDSRKKNDGKKPIKAKGKEYTKWIILTKSAIRIWKRLQAAL